MHIRLHVKTVLLQFHCLFVAGQAPVSSHLTLTSLVATYENIKRPAPVMGTFFMSQRCPHVRAFTVLLTENFAHMQPCPLYLLQVCWQPGGTGGLLNQYLGMGEPLRVWNPDPSKEMQIFILGMWKGFHLSIEGIRKGYLVCQKWYIKR